MFDYLRDLTRSADEKQQEALSAYLDGSLTPAESRRLQEALAADEALQEQLAELRAWREQLRALPRRGVQRNFTLDPALYKPPKREPLVQAYPALRTATALAAIMFVIALAALLGGVSTSTEEAAMPVAMQAAQPAEEAMSAEMELETAVEESAADAVEAPAAAFMTEDEVPAAELLREKPDDAPPLDEFVQDEGNAAGGAREAPAAKTEESPPMAEAFPEAATGVAADMAAAESQPLPPSEVAGDGEEAEGMIANTLLLVTLLLGVLFLVLGILTLLARRRR
jgi:hypothetical protein